MSASKTSWDMIEIVRVLGVVATRHGIDRGMLDGADDMARAAANRLARGDRGDIAVFATELHDVANNIAHAMMAVFDDVAAKIKQQQGKQ